MDLKTIKLGAAGMRGEEAELAETVVVVEPFFKLLCLLSIILIFHKSG